MSNYKGRQKGAKGKMNFNAMELAQELGIDPLEFLLRMARGDYEYFGFTEPNKVSYTNAGIEFEEPNLKMSDRVTCAKEAAKYLHSAKQAMAISTDEAGFKITVEDYSKKK